MHSRTEVHINLEKAIEELDTDKVLKVGWVEKLRYPEELGGKYVAEVAAQNEYGAPHKAIDARPFMAPAVAQNKNAWMDILKYGLKKVLKGEATAMDVLDLVGLRAAGDIRKAIAAVTSPPLSPYTIAKRLERYGNKKTVGALTKPLVDTRLMIDTATHVVEKE